MAANRKSKSGRGNPLEGESMQAPNKRKHARDERSELDRHYREIGISAVAAALPYQSEAKNPKYAPAASHAKDEPEDVAA
jgi:hypothetical protein